MALKTDSIVHAEIIFYCFEILGNYLFDGRNQLGQVECSTHPPYLSTPQLPMNLSNKSYPLFVTWFIGTEQKLRGCIGTFTPMNLAQGENNSFMTIVHHDSSVLKDFVNMPLHQPSKIVVSLQYHVQNIHFYPVQYRF
jgi:hypothetical protein